jgi:hypothetical protein
MLSKFSRKREKFNNVQRKKAYKVTWRLSEGVSTGAVNSPSRATMPEFTPVSISTRIARISNGMMVMKMFV